MKHLQTYEKYKTLSRRKHIKGNVEKIIEEYAPWYDLSDYSSAIYRGVQHKDGRKINQNVYLINPSEHHRRSIDTDNIYTLIIDNSELWEDYPKRSESIICSTSHRYASMFGEVYRVIPIKQNAEFGICDTRDIFEAFVGLKYINDNIDTPRDLEDYLGRTFVMPHGSITDYKELSKLLTKDNLDFSLARENGETHSGMTVEKFDKIVEEYGSYLGYLEKLMDPEDNGFSLEEYSQDNPNLEWLFRNSDGYNGNEGNEVWTDSPCLLVREEYILRNY